MHPLVQRERRARERRSILQATRNTRKIEKALKENINYMWLSGLQTPDHNTISRFRSGVLKDTVKEVFSQVLVQLIEGKHVRLNNYHIDGTKIESVANRYTFVWAKQVSKQQQKLLDKIKVLLEEIQAEEERSEEETPDLVIDSARLVEIVNELSAKLVENTTADKGVKKKSRP
jgi:hypothetical protein